MTNIVIVVALTLAATIAHSETYPHIALEPPRHCKTLGGLVCQDGPAPKAVEDNFRQFAANASYLQSEGFNGSPSCVNAFNDFTCYVIGKLSNFTSCEHPNRIVPRVCYSSCVAVFSTCGSLSSSTTCQQYKNFIAPHGDPDCIGLRTTPPPVLNPGQITGIVIACLGFAVVVVAVFVFLFLRNRKLKRSF
ncbi:hypothetical protein AKO1_012174 [Acrasis kona]|uniref:FZ domain-containing protein n=1 Tax=Acrasis kona TaxID=1008807 RepID=A0AAW2ZF22_9EUKA